MSCAEQYLESHSMACSMDERKIEEYQESVYNSAKESFWRALREESPALSFFLNYWWLSLIVYIFGVIFYRFGYQVGSMAGLIVSVSAVLWVLWVCWFKWIHPIPDWKSDAFANFKEESPGLYQEVQDTLKFSIHGNHLEFLVEHHPHSSRRFLLLRDCISGEEYYVHNWTAHEKSFSIQ